MHPAPTSGRPCGCAKVNLSRPVEVEIGATDGALTEIVRGDLPPGTEIVLGEDPNEPSATGTTNPFAPPSRGGKSKKKGF